MKWLLPLNPDTLSERAEQGSRVRFRGSVVLSKTTETYSGQLWLMLLGHSFYSNPKQLQKKQKQNPTTTKPNMSTTASRFTVGLWELLFVKQLELWKVTRVRTTTPRMLYHWQKTAERNMMPLDIHSVVSHRIEPETLQLTYVNLIQWRTRPIATAAMKIKVFLCNY